MTQSNVTLVDVWAMNIQKVLSPYTQRELSIAANSPEEAIELFKKTMFGRHHQYRILSITKTCSTYVETPCDAS